MPTSAAVASENVPAIYRQTFIRDGEISIVKTTNDDCIIYDMAALEYKEGTSYETIRKDVRTFLWHLGAYSSTKTGDIYVALKFLSQGSAPEEMGKLDKVFDWERGQIRLSIDRETKPGTIYISMKGSRDEIKTRRVRLTRLE